MKGAFMKILSAFVFSLTCFVSLSLFPYSLSAEGPATSRRAVPELSTSGTAEIRVPADQARVSFSVVTDHETSSEAIRENSVLVEKLIAALRSGGITKDEYQTGDFSVTPQYEHPRTGYGSGKLTGYQVRNSLLVSTGRIEILGKLIDAAAVAGANRIDYVSFGISDMRAERQKVIAQATKNAFEDAEYLAESAGLTLKKILSIQVDDAYGGGGFHPKGRAIAMEASFAPDVPLEAGMIPVRARVMVTWQVEQ
jgi:uncharacterized protein